MTIRFSDLSPADQTEVTRWINEVIPPLLTQLQVSIDRVTENRDELQVTEDIFNQFYTSYDIVMRTGYIQEVLGLVGLAFTDPVIDPALVQAAAVNPLSVPLLFPPGNIDIDPVQTAELRADVADYQTTIPPYTGTPPSATATGANERQALLDEANELGMALPDVSILQDFWQSQNLALTTQINALNALNAELDVGETGKSNVVSALANANAAQAAVQALILAGVVPPASRLSTDIPARVNEIDLRRIEITDPVTGDHIGYRDLRYYWLRRRLNLSYGSLQRLERTKKARDDLLAQQADLTAELAYYVSITP